MTLNTGIVGLGRIGRGVLRNNFVQGKGGRFNIRAVCDVMSIDHVAYLLANDSTYGRPPFPVDYDGDNLLLDGTKVRYLKVDRRRSSPDDESQKILRSMDLDVLFDATGTASIKEFRNLIADKIAKKILCTWNVAGCDISLVYGINDADYDPSKHDVISASTCTGNALVPICHILDKHIGIDFARVITIHPQLSDQRVLDGYHSSSQLGRGSAASIIPTSTNVAKSTTLVLPALQGKLDSMSYRVPTAIVSVMDVTATLTRTTTHEECESLFLDYAKNQLSGIIHCDYGDWGHQKASIDYMETAFSSIVLMHYMTLSRERQIGLSLMHDNEHAYCCRVLDIMKVLEGTTI